MELGYHVGYRALLASDFMLPQNRKRIYILAVRKNLFENTFSILDYFRRWGNNLDALKSLIGPPLPVDAFLLPESDAHVKAEIVRRQAARETAKKAGHDGDKGDWHKKHARFAESKFQSWPLPVPKCMSKNLWFHFRTPREREVILAHQGKAWVDASQEISRARETDNLCAPTVTPGQILWKYDIGNLGGRDILGRESMSLQGQPWPKLKNFDLLSEAQAANLAGNSYASTSYMAVLMSALFAWPDADALVRDKELQETLMLSSSLFK